MICSESGCALCAAAESGDTAALQSRITHDANLEERNGDGWTPLMVAAFAGRMDTVQVLLGFGADKEAATATSRGLTVGSRRPRWWSPLRVAIWRRHVDIVRLLLAAGANNEAKCEDGWTLLMFAVESGHADCVRLLLAAGADNEAILRARMREVPSVVWDGQGDNPYFGYLALADVIIVTCDSVSMISEACSTGKPVYLVALEGDSARFRKFHEALLQAGVIRRFEKRPADALESRLWLW